MGIDGPIVSHDPLEPPPPMTRTVSEHHYQSMLAERDDLRRQLKVADENTSRWIEAQCETQIKLDDTREKLAEANETIERLREGYREAIEDIESWACYVSDYFQEKHDLEGCLELHRKRVEGGEGGGDGND